MAATKATHHRAVAAILLLAIAVGTAQAAAVSETEPAGAAGGRGQGDTAPAPTTSARVLLPSLAVTVRCTKTHVVLAGETCASVARAFGLTVAQFMVLNQEQHYTCTAAPLPHGRWVCVRGSAIG